MQRGRDGPRRRMKRPQSTPSGGHRLQWSVDALQRRNDDLRAQLREARRGAQEREALRLHNEELQSQLGEARRAAEALEVARRCGKDRQREVDELRRSEKRLKDTCEASRARADALAQKLRAAEGEISAARTREELVNRRHALSYLR
ncbi:antigenic protein [Trypanosoma rangeli]|uniref:Antigenic protein n=1 Tax=Trypanosoma rangeli TaxID=5698 RepID=A0A3R7NF25_TRYRA|nr:antigenic protein [Trypanosoma rangeli]RNF01735.1 antigenic protein [Trypanosoma rangeli]|eukprot:RNF01735.1 antigenic protein [Trypanosoma rangeli]